MQLADAPLRAAAQRIFIFTLALGATFFASELVRSAAAADMQWIWTPSQPIDKQAPAGSVYFRKSFPLGQPESGEIQISCDDAYELYVNGRKVADGDNWRVMKKHDIVKFLTPGRNTVAVKVTNKEMGSAGLAARVVVKEAGGTHVAHNTDGTWRTSVQEFPNWTKHSFNEVQWLPARVVGEFGKTSPWLDEVQMEGGAPAGRFETLPEFRVETVVPPSETGSLIAMAFNEFGDVLASREGTGILLIRDTDKDGKPDKSELLTDKVMNAQGMCALNGQVFAVGKGPDGLGLYRISDTDGDRHVDAVDTMLKFTGDAAEHGPHAVTLGPDGLLYVVLGNHTQAEKAAEPTSPLHHVYEGDLLSPKYEDPHGHAAGIKAPCGTIIRTDINGSFVEQYSGGLRNCYSLAFNREGELFTFDSDMEWDSGMPWYRATRLLHVTPGSEFGSRSGWSVWPDYYFDSLPPVVDAGRGSPTGMAIYNHVMYPRRYHDAVFLGDWARGRIVAVYPKSVGGSYQANVETFAAGKPLNVTGLDVGPDGALWFCTGGRDTEGGIYRVVWRGKVPPEITDLGTGLQQAIRQPQLSSAFARQRIAIVKQKLGAAWDDQLTSFVKNTGNPAADRCRGMDLMHLFGPFPSAAVLMQLGSDADVQVRAKAAYLMGIHADDTTKGKLVQMLRDKDPLVQRHVCEALVRAGQTPKYEELALLLNSTHRHVQYAATRLLETMPRDEYLAKTLKTEKARVFVQGSLALLVMDPDKDTCIAVLKRAQTLMAGFVSDPDFLDLLRVMQLAFLRGEIKADDVPQLAEKIALEYPTKNPQMNRELVRLVAYLDNRAAGTRMLEQLASDIPSEDKMQIAMYARFLTGWTTAQKLELLKYYEKARTLTGGHSFAGYIDNVSRDFFVGLTEQERATVLADGAKWPSSALAVLAKLPKELPPETIEQIITLDKQMLGSQTDAAKKLAIGVVAVLGRSSSPRASEYIREIYEKFPDRRGHIAMALTQNPTVENWPLLMQSLPVVDGAFAQQVLVTLAKIDERPDKPEAYRQVILRGLKLGENGGPLAVKLLEKWSGSRLGGLDDNWETSLANWQGWFANTYPDEPEAKLPVESAENKWTNDELLTYLNGAEGAHADSRLGAAVFAKAQCANCHKFGDRGDGIGPDLTTVGRRFQKKEILESVLFPSQVISDQYASKTIITTDGRSIAGLVSPQPDGSVIVLQTNGQKVNIASSEIESSKPNKVSAMPEGLLNNLTLEEVANLFAYLGTSAQNDLTSRRVPARK